MGLPIPPCPSTSGSIVTSGTGRPVPCKLDFTSFLERRAGACPRRNAAIPTAVTIRLKIKTTFNLPLEGKGDREAVDEVYPPHQNNCQSIITCGDASAQPQHDIALGLCQAIRPCTSPPAVLSLNQTIPQTRCLSNGNSGFRRSRLHRFPYGLRAHRRRSRGNSRRQFADRFPGCGSPRCALL